MLIATYVHICVPWCALLYCWLMLNNLCALSLLFEWRKTKITTEPLIISNNEECDNNDIDDDDDENEEAKYYYFNTRSKSQQRIAHMKWS